MDNILNSIFEPQFSQLTLRPVSGNRQVKSCGITYQLDPDIGNGYYWIQPIRDICAVTIANLSFEHEAECNYRHPAYISVGNYAPNLLEPFSSDSLAAMYSKSLNDQNYLIGSISEAGKFEAGLGKRNMLQYVSITMLPEYYHSFLPEYFSLSEVDLIESVKQIQSSPEVNILFAQISKANPTASNGALYYESKVIELLSLLQMQREQHIIFPDMESLDEETKELINRVAAFIRNHCEQRLSIDFLSKTFYTNKNKLSHLFQLVYHTSIPEYVQRVRIDLAKDLLLHSRQTIQEIAVQVGYKNQGSFSVCFKAETGMTPSDYRRIGH